MGRLVNIITDKRIIIGNGIHTTAKDAAIAYAKESTFNWFRRNCRNGNVFWNDQHCYNHQFKTYRKVMRIFERYFLG